MHIDVRGFLSSWIADVPLNKHPTSAIIEAALVRVDLDSIDHKSPVLQITFNQYTDLFESTRIIPSLESDKVVPSRSFVALTRFRVTSRLFLLFVSPFSAESDLVESV
jgi:hypothetical protein